MAIDSYLRSCAVLIGSCEQAERLCPVSSSWHSVSAQLQLKLFCNSLRERLQAGARNYACSGHASERTPRGLHWGHSAVPPQPHTTRREGILARKADVTQRQTGGVRSPAPFDLLIYIPFVWLPKLSRCRPYRQPVN